MFFKKVKKVFNFFYYILSIQVIMFITSILPNIKYSNRIRGFLLKPFFKDCGKNFQVAKGVLFNQSRKISIGEDVYIAHNVWINGAGNLNIESGVIISPNVVIATTKHIYENGKISNTKSELSPINIGEGTWITSNCTITKGVNIGKGCIIAANSCVVNDIPDYCLVGGVPAKIIKRMK